MAVLLLLLPAIGSALVVDQLTLLMVYIMLAVMWNLLAGYAALISVGHQAFIGLGGYLVLRRVESGLPPFAALFCGGVAVLAVAWPMSWFVPRLKPAEFVVSLWVLAEAIRSVVMFAPLIQGETGRSLVLRYLLLRGQIGGEIQAIRDDEEAAASIGVSTLRVKRWILLISALGCALAGTIWLASAITCQPRTAFGINWSVLMLFMVLVGGLGNLLGPLVGALLVFVLQEASGDLGAWYLAGIDVIAILFALYLPRGIRG